MSGKLKVALGVIGFFIALIVVGVAIDSRRNAAMAKQQAEQSARTKATQEAREEAFNAMTGAEHLQTAKSIATPNGTGWYQWTRHLGAIKQTDPEFAEAQALLGQKQRDAEAAAERVAIEKDPLEVADFKWSTGGFGSVGILKVTFKNRSTKPVGNIVYKTEYKAETGLVVSRGSGVIAKVIGPNETRTIEVNDGFINSQSDTANFNIVSWQFVEDNR
jgi:hypothetical protein